jgi:hypothetical protein
LLRAVAKSHVETCDFALKPGAPRYTSRKIRLRGVMDGIDLAREVKMRWPLLPVILT